MTNKALINQLPCAHQCPGFKRSRRQFLLQALSGSSLSVLPAIGWMTAASASPFGRVSGKMPPGKSFFRITGDVQINDKAANSNTPVQANDVITTGSKSEAIFVIGKDAFLLRENTELRLSGDGFLLQHLRLLTGKMLAAFGKREKKESQLLITSSTATLGVRGTGVYIESEPDHSFLCTCYGVVNVVAKNAPETQAVIASHYHDAPRLILASGKERIKPADTIGNHTDLELMLIEELAGRAPPFNLSDIDYTVPRRDY